MPVSNHTVLSSICTHETLCHVSQNRVAVLHTLPLTPFKKAVLTSIWCIFYFITFIFLNAAICNMLGLIVPLEVITNFPSHLGTATQTSFFMIDGSWHSISSSQILGTSISSIDIFIAGTNVVVLL